MPKSYDDIIRSTVPEPDSGFRPTHDQELAALDGTHTRPAEEAALYARVFEALRGTGVEVSGITVEIDGTKVTLAGRVADVQVLPQLEGAVRAIEAVGDLVDRIVVIPYST
ncbi:MAG: hypothetical protein IPQ07_09970 [Myxococcales bacterium]|nr:hypothetical protein [Myxococcales bacterium]